jgi:hypothetical protein
LYCVFLLLVFTFSFVIETTQYNFIKKKYMINFTLLTLNGKSINSLERDLNRIWRRPSTLSNSHLGGTHVYLQRYQNFVERLKGKVITLGRVRTITSQNINVHLALILAFIPVCFWILRSANRIWSKSYSQ